MTAQYHDALDRYEARMRAEQEERELDEAPKCCCFEYMGDNEDCPLHGTMYDIPLAEFNRKLAAGITRKLDENYQYVDGSDTSMTTQLNDAGFGPGGVL